MPEMLIFTTSSSWASSVLAGDEVHVERSYFGDSVAFIRLKSPGEPSSMAYLTNKEALALANQLIALVHDKETN